MAQKYERFIIQNSKVLLNATVYPYHNGETVILLHGGPGVPDPMTEVALELNRRYQVITFEQRGTGLSTNPEASYRMEDYISDIDAIADYFKVDSFHLFGHSWGGLYAQIYAEEKPERIRSLFLCSPSSGTNQTWKSTEKEVMHFNKKVATTAEWLSMGWNSLLGLFGSDKAYQKVFFLVLKNYHKNYPKISVNREQLKAVKAMAINKTRKCILAYKSLSTMTVAPFKIMITYGSDDIYGESKKKVKERYPSAQIIVIDRTGHIPWLHNPLAFSKIVDKFYAIGNER